MDFKDNYLTINQLAKSCSISRSTILRMEKDEILTPAYIDPENGYRYYDCNCVLRVARNLALQELGVTHKELKEYYQTPNNYMDLLQNLQRKMQIMEYHIASLKLQLHQVEHLSMQEYFFPEMYCFSQKLTNLTDLTKVHPQIWKTFNQAVQMGYIINRRMHPFVLVDFAEIRDNSYQNIGYDYEICIPVIPTQEEDHLLHFSATNTLSVILYGGSSDMKIAFEQMTKEITQNHYISEKQARVVAVVNSFPSEEIPIEHWVVRACIPITKP